MESSLAMSSAPMCPINLAVYAAQDAIQSDTSLVHTNTFRAKDSYLSFESLQNSVTYIQSAQRTVKQDSFLSTNKFYARSICQPPARLCVGPPRFDRYCSFQGFVIKYLPIIDKELSKKCRLERSHYRRNQRCKNGDYKKNFNGNTNIKQTLLCASQAMESSLAMSYAPMHPIDFAVTTGQDAMQCDTSSVRTDTFHAKDSSFEPLQNSVTCIRSAQPTVKQDSFLLMNKSHARSICQPSGTLSNHSQLVN